ncbi:MAG: lasso peptide biosynthesis B2 protein [Burkholderiales bacterium]|nr:lasso peptide biosynthesis B2 protein [Anaerolineae bacterium]
MYRITKQARKFWCLSLADKGLALQTLALLWAIRLAMWLLPYATLRRWVGRLQQPGNPPQDVTLMTNKIVLATASAGRFVPDATCLAQSLTAQTLLTRRGCPHEFRLGVARGDNGGIKAHAWIENNGEVILGLLPDLASYTVLAYPQSGQF